MLVRARIVTDTTDTELLTAAIDALTAGNQTAFGRCLGHPDGASVRAWLARGTLDRTQRLLCTLIVEHPDELRGWLPDPWESRASA